MEYKFRTWVLVLFGALSSMRLYAGVSPCRITKDMEILVFEACCFEKLEHIEQTAMFSDVVSHRGWTVLQAENPFILRKPGEVLWIRFFVQNQAEDTHHRFLEFPDAHNASIQLYSLLPDGHIHTYQPVGFDLPLETREFKYKNILYNLDLPYGESRWYYARIESRYESSFLTLIISDSFLFSYVLPEYYWLGIFYGILFIMAMYNLFIFSSTRERVYVYYVLYVVCCAIYTGGEDTILFQLFWPSYPVFNHYLFVLSLPLISFSYILYSTLFLELKKEYLRWVYMCLGASILSFGLALSDHMFLYKVSTFLSYIPFLVLYGIAIRLYGQGKLFTRFFLIGSTFILLSLAVFLLRKLNVLPSNILTFYTFNFAFVVEVMMFSYALADKLKLIKKEKEETQIMLIHSLQVQEQLKDKVNIELEEKVKERTSQLERQSVELEEKNKQLQSLTEQLNNMNSRLDIDNWQLKKQVAEETKSRILWQQVSLEEFSEIFPNEAACYRFLEELKEQERYTCKKCGSHEHVAGDKLFSRKCARCKYNESVTANTLFQGVKFPIEKAFYITYRSFSDTDKTTIEELAKLVQIRTATVWAFRKKVLEAKEQKKKAKVKLTSWEQIIQ